MIVEFPTLERASEWYTLPEYAEALAIRQSVLERTLLFAEGLVSAEDVASMSKS